MAVRATGEVWRGRREKCGKRRGGAVVIAGWNLAAGDAPLAGIECLSLHAQASVACEQAGAAVPSRHVPSTAGPTEEKMVQNYGQTLLRGKKKAIVKRVSPS